MSKFEVLVEEVSRVEDHPNADRLSLVGVRGYNCVSAKLEDGSHRYKVGDKVVYIPEGAVVPDWLLKKGFWNEKENKCYVLEINTAPGIEGTTCKKYTQSILESLA